MTVGDDGPQSEYDLAKRMEKTLHRLAPLTQTNSPPVQPTSKTNDIDTIMGVLSHIAGASLQDIDRMIDHLSTLRERLKVDGDRIQHEIDDYMLANSLRPAFRSHHVAVAGEREAVGSAGVLLIDGDLSIQSQTIGPIGHAVGEIDRAVGRADRPFDGREPALHQFRRDAWRQHTGNTWRCLRPGG